jgi:iron-sulfur cluster insertion protein
MPVVPSSFEMNPSKSLTSQSLSITENAIKKIKMLTKEKKNSEPSFLRLSVLGGGCSGLQYNFKFESAKEADDIIFEKDGIQVVIDETSLELLSGSVIDYSEDLIGSAFTIKNPKAASSCGCGNSFSIV